MKIAASLLMVGMFAVVTVGTAHAATDPTLKCKQAKLKALGKVKSCLEKNTAGVLGGKTDGSASCLTKFTDALTKIDAKATAAGTKCRHIDHGDGTVSDLNTGLMWEKKSAGTGCTHCMNDSFTWSTGSPYKPDGTAFTTFLYGLNGVTTTDGVNTITPCFAGHCDWRLPTIQELLAITDGTQGNCSGGSGPCIDPVFGYTQAAGYWSITSNVSSDVALGVGFGGTNFFQADKVNPEYVRAVRGGL